MPISRILSRFVRLVSVFAVVACSSGEPTVVDPSMFLSVSPPSATVLQGDSSIFEVNITTNGEFEGTPQLSMTGAPSGVSVRITMRQMNATLATAHLSMSVGATVEPGTYIMWLYASNPAADPVRIPFSLRILYKEPPCTLTDLCEQWATTASASSQYTSDEWAAQQATGAPNVNGCRDDGKAWASAAPDDGQWLELDYQFSVFPTKVEVFENYGTSAIVTIELKDEESHYHIVYSATPAFQDCPRTLAVPVSNVDFRTKGVRIRIDQARLGDWSEVDAVRLTGYRQR